MRGKGQVLESLSQQVQVGTLANNWRNRSSSWLLQHSLFSKLLLSCSGTGVSVYGLRNDFARSVINHLSSIDCASNHRMFVFGLYNGLLVKGSIFSNDTSCKCSYIMWQIRLRISLIMSMSHLCSGLALELSPDFLLFYDSWNMVVRSHEDVGDSLE